MDWSDVLRYAAHTELNPETSHQLALLLELFGVRFKAGPVVPIVELRSEGRIAVAAPNTVPYERSRRATSPEAPSSQFRLLSTSLGLRSIWLHG